MGKSGHVGRKLAATFASTGTTAYFVHSDEAAHGDLGMIKSGDIFVGISFSGEGDELVRIIPVLKKMNIPIIAMTGHKNSTLARSSDVALVTEIDREACPLNLAPTSSTTVTMALGDALAGALMVAKGFKEEDFARSHPAGALGRRLLYSVSDVMRNENLPVANSKIDIIDAIDIMARCHLGCIVFVDKNNKTEGIFTEGDLCRLIRFNTDIKKIKVKDVMKKHPIYIRASESAHAALQMIEKNKINNLLVQDGNGMFLGIVHVQDLVRKKML